jgi:hypothetical protein
MASDSFTSLSTAHGRPPLELTAMQGLPPQAAACQAWRLASGWLCLGPVQAQQDGAAVHGVARAGDWVCVPDAHVAVWALVPSVLNPLPLPTTQTGWQALVAQLCTQQCRQAADLAAMRTGPATDRVRRMLLMLAGPGQTWPALPSLRAMSQLVDAAPETVSRVVSALRHSRLLDGGRRAPATATVGAQPLAALALPRGLTRSEAAPRRARLQALKNATIQTGLSA